MQPPARPRPSREAGFSLVELLVTIVVVVMIIIAVLTVFDVASRTARTQTHVADMQQSQRVAQQTIVRAVRMAGRGGLPTWEGLSTLPSGLALELLNNAAAGTLIAGESDAPVLEGTDVLTVRGIFNTPVYQHDPIAPDFFYDDATGVGTLTLTRLTSTGITQPLEAMRDAIDRVDAGGGDHPEALFLMSPLGEWAVMEMVAGGSYVESGGVVQSVTLDFVGDGGTFSPEYQALSKGGSISTTLDTVVYAGILEEYQFYVRALRAVAGDAGSELMPQFVRARLFPNTTTAWGDTVASLTEVVADNVLDLQVAIGMDTDADQEITEGIAGETPAPDEDEWLFNDAADDPLEAKWSATGNPLYYLRINTLVQTDRPEPYYEAEALATIEDKDYSLSPFDVYNQEQQRYHRRRLRTTVDLRNL